MLFRSLLISLLAGAAGWALPKGTTPYQMKLLTVVEAANPVLFRIAQNVAADWRSIGLSVTTSMFAEQYALYGVATAPGPTPTTRMPWGASSERSVSVSPRTAYFAGPYAVYPNTPISPAVDEMVTRCPRRRSIIDGTTARMACSVPK